MYLSVCLCFEQALELRSIKELLQDSSAIDAAKAKATTQDSEQVLNATTQNSEHNLQGIRRADMQRHVTPTLSSFDGIVQATVVDAVKAKATTQDSEQVPKKNDTIVQADVVCSGLQGENKTITGSRESPVVLSGLQSRQKMTIGDRESPEISEEMGTDSGTRARSGQLTAFRNDIYLQYDSYASIRSTNQSMD